MDTPVIIALVTGVLSLVGITLNVVKDVRKDRTDASLANNSAAEARASRIDEKYDRYIKQLEEREAAALKRFDDAQAAWAEERGQLQTKYQEAIHRLDALDEQRTRDQACIMTLQQKIEQLEANQ